MAIIAPATTEMQTTATDCLKSEFLSGHAIFLNSVFKPFKKLGFGVLAVFAEPPMRYAFQQLQETYDA